MEKQKADIIIIGSLSADSAIRGGARRGPVLVRDGGAGV